jgi:uncharacterized membrane protein (UPF0127 family)
VRRFVLVLALIAACDRAPEPTPETTYENLGDFGTGAVEIITATDTLKVAVEVASTPEQQQLGLMERTTLGENAGMIFIYDTPQDTLGGFWMYRTRIPLDIAFVDSAGRIVTIHTMQPCASPNAALCESYRPTAPFLHALEVNSGYFQRHNVKVGDIVRVN